MWSEQVCERVLKKSSKEQDLFSTTLKTDSRKWTQTIPSTISAWLQEDWVFWNIPQPMWDGLTCSVFIFLPQDVVIITVFLRRIPAVIHGNHREVCGHFYSMCFSVTYSLSVSLSLSLTPSYYFYFIVFFFFLQEATPSRPAQWLI